MSLAAAAIEKRRFPILPFFLFLLPVLRHFSLWVNSKTRTSLLRRHP